ncbi:MAG: hypothetical protein RI573_08440 [Balneolaceae bacterium]|nr:hypothetical protein [Balneolaceae bacterium]
MSFSIFLDPRAVEDIQESIDYYEEQEIGLGKRFEEHLDKHLSILKRESLLPGAIRRSTLPAFE